MSHPTYELDPYLKRSVAIKAQQLVGHYGITPDEVEDIAQDLIVAILPRLRHFNPARAQWTTFVTRLVERQVANYLEWRQTARRSTLKIEGYGPHWSDECGALGMTGLQGAGHWQDAEEHLLSEITMQPLLAALPPVYRRVCEGLLAGNSLAGIAKELGIPRTSLYPMLHRLRTYFLSHGLVASVPDHVTLSSRPVCKTRQHPPAAPESR